MNLITRFAHFVLFLLALAGLRSAATASDQAAPLKTRVIVVASASTLRTVNHDDARAASKVWIDAIAAARGFEVDSHFIVANTIEDVRRALLNFSADIFILDPFEYLRLAPLGLLRPVVIVDRQGGADQSYSLVARCDPSCPPLEGLRGKRVLYYPASDAQLGKAWIETLLDDKGLGRAAGFFTVADTPKSSSACLPVFFGNADACIVTTAQWITLREMNPQIAKQLGVVATSPPYLDGIVCLHASHKDHVDEIVRGLLELQFSPEGKQILMVFRASGSGPFKSEYLETVRDLWNRYRSISSGPGSLERAVPNPPVKRRP